MSSFINRPTLSVDRAIELVGLADGALHVEGLPVLSLPCVAEKRGDPSRTVMVTHFERARSEYFSALLLNPRVSLHFVVGFYYIDPSWIPRQPHAPTEVKAVFEFTGRATLIERSHPETLSMMSEVTRAKQELYCPGSNWTIDSLPAPYVSRLFPMIAELEIEIEHYSMSRLMVLDHLSAEHREQVVARISEAGGPCARAALRLFDVAYRA